jgi:hypothetical protein
MPENPLAFPVLTKLHDRDPGGRMYDAHMAGGMTLRDYFAAAALTGIYAQPWHPEMGCDWFETEEKRATVAYKQADAMLIERAKGGR